MISKMEILYNKRSLSVCMCQTWLIKIWR